MGPAVLPRRSRHRQSIQAPLQLLASLAHSCILQQGDWRKSLLHNGCLRQVRQHLPQRVTASRPPLLSVQQRQLQAQRQRKSRVGELQGGAAAGTPRLATFWPPCLTSLPLLCLTGGSAISIQPLSAADRPCQAARTCCSEQAQH